MRWLRIPTAVCEGLDVAQVARPRGLVLGKDRERVDRPPEGSRRQRSDRRRVDATAEGEEIPLTGIQLALERADQGRAQAPGVLGGAPGRDALVGLPPAARRQAAVAKRRVLAPPERPERPSRKVRRSGAASYPDAQIALISGSSRRSAGPKRIMRSRVVATVQRPSLPAM